MNTNNSLDALFKPGKSSRYFDISNPLSIYIGDKGFNLWNSWWLAELSRLVYREDKHNVYEENKKYRTDEILKKVGIEIVGEISNDDTSTYGLLLKAKAINRKSKTEMPCLILAFCGSNELRDWKINFRAYQCEFYQWGKVHRGFQKAFLSIKDDLLAFKEINDYPLFLTGHSLGAALATLVTAYLSNSNINMDSCYTYGSPRVGDADFANALEGKNIYRMVNYCDVVTMVPFDVAAIQYRHVGHPCFINDDMLIKTDMKTEEIEQYQQAQFSNLEEMFSATLLIEKLKAGETEFPSFLSDHAPANYVAKIEQNLNKK